MENPITNIINRNYWNKSDLKGIQKMEESMAEEMIVLIAGDGKKFEVTT